MPTVLAFLALLLPLSLSPGPAVIALVGLGMRHGVAKSMPFFFGLLASVFVIATASGFGLSAILFADQRIYETVRAASIAYVVYLGWKLIVAKPKVVETEAGEYGFIDGMMLTALNPKFYAVVTAIFSQFVGPDPASIWILILGFTAVLAFSQIVWLSAGVLLRPLLKSEKALRVQSLIFGLLLIGVAFTLAISGT